MPVKKSKPSNYTLLTRWFYDGSKTTTVPEDVINDKSIGQMYLLYYFQSSSYGLVINKLFNNYGIFALDRVEVFKFMKQCITLSGYRPPFVKRGSKTKSKMLTILRSKYPYIKREETNMLIEHIDNSEEKDAVYEMFGIYKHKKKKTTKAEVKRMEQEAAQLNQSKKDEISLDSLMGNFS